MEIIKENKCIFEYYYDELGNIIVNIKRDSDYYDDDFYSVKLPIQIDRRKVISINFGERIDGVDNNAFEGCCKLEKIRLPKKLGYVSPGAFKNCINLKEVEIYQGPFEKKLIWEDLLHKNSDKMEEESEFVIYDTAFEGCKSLKSIKPYGNDKFKKNILKSSINDENFFHALVLTSIVHPDLFDSSKIDLREVGNDFGYIRMAIRHNDEILLLYILNNLENEEEFLEGFEKSLLDYSFKMNTPNCTARLLEVKNAIMKKREKILGKKDPLDDFNL